MCPQCSYLKLANVKTYGMPRDSTFPSSFTSLFPLTKKHFFWIQRSHTLTVIRAKEIHLHHSVCPCSSWKTTQSIIPTNVLSNLFLSVCCDDASTPSLGTLSDYPIPFPAKKFTPTIWCKTMANFPQDGQHLRWIYRGYIFFHLKRLF